MKESYSKYRVHLLQRLKVGDGVAPPRAKQQGNGGRQAQQLLLLLLLGAVLIITYLVRFPPCTQVHCAWRVYLAFCTSVEQLVILCPHYIASQAPIE